MVRNVLVIDRIMAPIVPDAYGLGGWLGVLGSFSTEGFDQTMQMFVHTWSKSVLN